MPPPCCPYLFEEPGGSTVRGVLDRAAVSSVNWAEVLQKALSRGVEVTGLQKDIEALGLRIVPFTAEHARVAVFLWLQTKHAGLSLADRACLAVATAGRLPVLTADGAWKELPLDVEVRAIR